VYGFRERRERASSVRMKEAVSGGERSVSLRML